MKTISKPPPATPSICPLTRLFCSRALTELLWSNNNRTRAVRSVTVLTRPTSPTGVMTGMPTASPRLRPASMTRLSCASCGSNPSTRPMTCAPWKVNRGLAVPYASCSRRRSFSASASRRTAFSADRISLAAANVPASASAARFRRASTSESAKRLVSTIIRHCTGDATRVSTARIP